MEGPVLDIDEVKQNVHVSHDILGDAIIASNLRFHVLVNIICNTKTVIMQSI